MWNSPSLLAIRAKDLTTTRYPFERADAALSFDRRSTPAPLLR